MSATWEYISNKWLQSRKAKKNCAGSTVISSKIRTKLKGSLLKYKVRHLDDNDSRHLMFLGSLISDDEWDDRKKRQAVVQSHSLFEQPGRDLLPNVLQTKKISTSSKKFIEKLEQKVKESIMEPVKPGGITKASPVVDNYTNNGELRFWKCISIAKPWTRKTQYQI